MRTDPDIPIFTCLSALGVSRFMYKEFRLEKRHLQGQTKCFEVHLQW
jgi:hypothetical protein